MVTMREPIPFDEATLKWHKEKREKKTQAQSTTSPTLIASANLTPGMLGAQEQQEPQFMQLLAQASAPARVLPPEVQPRLVDPLIRTPINLKTGTPTGLPNSQVANVRKLNANR
jgi:hypothetical protein